MRCAGGAAWVVHGGILASSSLPSFSPHRGAADGVVFAAGGAGVGILFRKGKVVKKFPEDKLVEVLLAEVDRYEKSR